MSRADVLSFKQVGYIQWEHTYVAGDKTFCIYLADSEAFIYEHSERSGFPATVVTEVRTIIDPLTAAG